jgi:putative resolvase
LLAARGRRVMVADRGETTGDLVPDMTWVLTSMCVRQRRARNRTPRAVSAGKRDPHSLTCAG